MRKITAIMMAAVLAAVVLGGCSSVSGTGTYDNAASTAKTEENAENTSEVVTTSEEPAETTTETEVIDNRKNTESFSEDDFEVTRYPFFNSIGDSLLFLSVKNNSSAVVKVSGNGVAKDAEGNSIAANDCYIDVLGPGEETVTYF